MADTGPGENLRLSDDEAAAVNHLVATMRASAAIKLALSRSSQVPGPATIRALRDREAAWRDVENRYGLLSAADVADMAGSLSANRSEYASAQRRRSRILGVERAGRVVYPGFQFSADGKALPGMQPVLANFRDAEWPAESVMFWFTAPNGYLDDAEPAQRLRTDPTAVLDAAANAAASTSASRTLPEAM